MPDAREDVTTVNISKEDAAFLIGKGGRTKRKLIRVSGCDLDLVNETTLAITGTRQKRQRAVKYVKFVTEQRVGTVKVDEDDAEGEDCTVLPVPQEAVGFVTGKHGNFLRTLEDEHNVIMFFAEVGDKNEEFEHLVIFGDRRGRRGAQLTVMSVVETKLPEYYTAASLESGETYEESDDDWGTSLLELKGPDLAYAVGKKGATRKKVRAASNCIIQYVNGVAFMSGTKRERQNAQDYIKWLLSRQDGQIATYRDRDDCTLVSIPNECIGYVTGNNRETLSAVEEMYGTLMFFVGGDSEKLAIFGPARSRRAAELSVMSSVERKRPGHFTDGVTEKEGKNPHFDTDRLFLQDDEMSYALGREGATRKKIATASHAVLMYVGNIAFIAGTYDERQRCRDYISFLLKQRMGREVVIDVKGRDDVTEVELPDGCAGWVAGSRGSELRRMEEESGTFCFIGRTVSGGGEKVLICGHEDGSKYLDSGRKLAAKLTQELIDQKLSHDEQGDNDEWRKHDCWNTERARKRSWSPSRQTDRSEKWQSQSSWSSSWPSSWPEKKGDDTWKEGKSWESSDRGRQWPSRDQDSSKWQSSGQSSGWKRSRDDVVDSRETNRSPTPPWRKKHR